MAAATSPKKKESHGHGAQANVRQWISRWIAREVVHENHPDYCHWGHAPAVCLCAIVSPHPSRLNPSEGARPRLVSPLRGADRQVLPTLCADSEQDPGKPRRKLIAERLALFLKTAGRKRDWFLCRRPERQTVLSRPPPGPHPRQLKWIAAARLPDHCSSQDATTRERQL